MSIRRSDGWFGNPARHGNKRSTQPTQEGVEDECLAATSTQSVDGPERGAGVFSRMHLGSQALGTCKRRSCRGNRKASWLHDRQLHDQGSGDLQEILEAAGTLAPKFNGTVIVFDVNARALEGLTVPSFAKASVRTSLALDHGADPQPMRSHDACRSSAGSLTCMAVVAREHQIATAGRHRCWPSAAA